jgi:hypothetical protein
MRQAEAILLAPGDENLGLIGPIRADENTGVLKYRYRDSNPGFRRERAAS